MDPITASILLSAGTNLAGFGLKKFLGSDRPGYEIPDSARQALSLARIQAADPNMPGEMQVTITLRKVDCGTELAIEQSGVPAMIPAESCYLGWQESLALLASLVEVEIPDAPAS